MDTATVIASGVAAAAAAVAVVSTVRAVRSRRVIRDAVARVGGSPPSKRRHAIRGLEGALEDLERSLAAAQRDRARLAGAVHSAPMGVILTDDHGVVVTANPAASRFLGSSFGEAVAETRVRQAIDEAILSRSAVESEVEMYTPVRSVLEVTAIPLDFGVESIGAVAFVVDVTEARRVMAMRRDFIANVSHELKTPLAALAVLAETIADGVGDRETSARLASRVQSEAHRLADLVDDILDLSQAEAAEVVHEPVPLARVLAEVADELSGIATSRGVALVVAPVPEEARVRGDRRQLATLFENLMENAIKYSRGGGGGRPPEVTVETSVGGGVVTIAVVDEGIGISPAHADRIFERFYRVDRGRSRESGGSGLGLSIVRHIARTHRGDVTVESVEGEGSTFTVTLPMWGPV